MAEKDVIEIHLLEIQMLWGDRIPLTQSMFAVVIGLFLSVTILKTNLPIEFENIQSIVSSSFLLLGFICLLSAGFMVPFWLLSSRFSPIGNHIDLISRIALIAASVVSTLAGLGMIAGVCGAIGWAVGLVLFIVTGRWFVFPEGSIRYVRWQKVI